jgi:aminopeptidase N
MLDHAERAIRTFGRAFGAYPYPEIDVVLTGFASFGGMEYPTLILSNANRVTIAHELAHQWWYGTVGDDQFSEPWLDEGFATWSQRLPWDPFVACGGINWPSADARLTNDMAYWREHPIEYGTVVYSGGACMLAQLADGFGLERFVRILGRFAERNRFGIVRTEDFQATIEAAAARLWPSFPADFWDTWRVEP